MKEEDFAGNVSCMGRWSMHLPTLGLAPVDDDSRAVKSTSQWVPQLRRISSRLPERSLPISGSLETSNT